MLSRKAIYSILYLAVIVMASGCGIQERRDVYRRIPLGSPLSMEILKRCDQIAPNGSELILMYNISDNVDYYDPHLLFFDDSLKLYAACYFPSGMIESVADNLISGYLVSSSYKRRDWFRNDLPEKYRLNLIGAEGGRGRKSDKVVENMSLDSNGTAVIIYVMKSDDPYVGLDEKLPFSDPGFIETYTVPDTLRMPLSDLRFRYKESKVATSEGSPKGSWRWDHMLFPERSVLDDFYRDLFFRLSE